jgi:hypothetical protein
MGVPTSEVGYTSSTTGWGDHEFHKGHVVALKKERKKTKNTFTMAEFNKIFQASSHISKVLLQLLA